jgi:glycosyltransferase involved in cell wall biosynthesis
VLKSLRKHINAIKKIIVLSEFSKKILIQQGFSENAIEVKPNFVDYLQYAQHDKSNDVIYVGALQPYKGVDTIIKAWKDYNISIPLKIFGDGPQRAKLELMAVGLPIEFMGQQRLSLIFDELKKSRCVIVPSLCYENFPRIIVEAFAMATPVIASKLGAMAEIVNDGVTGLLFSPGDSADLYNKLKILLNDNVLLQNLSINARSEYEQKYTKTTNYQRLMEIYDQALK